MCQTDTTLFVVDDEPKVCKSVAALARSLNLRCRTFCSAEDFLDFLDANEQGCVLVDIRLGGMSGLELLKTLNEKGSCLPVILFSAYADIPLAVRAMQQGAVTVIEKPYRADELSDAIRKAMEIFEKTKKERYELNELRQRVSSLNVQEREVMARVIEAMPNKVIALEMDLAMRTVARLRAAVFEKMKCQGAVELAGVLSHLARLEDTLSRVSVSDTDQSTSDTDRQYR